MTRCTGDVNAIHRFASAGLLEVDSHRVMTIGVSPSSMYTERAVGVDGAGSLPILFALAIRFGRLGPKMFNDIMQAGAS